jgi:5-formyltetrahydrofolate cyclo-ligase
MNFFHWKKNEVLQINKYGMLEPTGLKESVPDVILVPLLAYDTNKYRLGYGKGFYDRYLNKNLKIFKNILTVGVAFSFQKHPKLPIKNKDVKLNYILTEQGVS